MEIVQTGLVVAGLVLPGWGWARRWGEGLLVAMVLSWISLFSWVVFAAVLSWPISREYLLGGQILVGVTGLIVAHRSGVRNWGIALDFDLGWGWIAFPMGLVAGWKAIAQPLSGVDVDFRWNYLAEMMVKTGGLSFYPATTSRDFMTYFWADGIPPLISSLYAWCYLIAGETNRVWTAIPVLMQWLAAVVVLRTLGRYWGGRTGGDWALLLGGASFLLQFAFNLGQETTCTAVGTGLMVLGLSRESKKSGAGNIGLAAAGAALVAAAREYGWAIVASGITIHVSLIWSRDRKWSRLAAWSLLAIPATWYVRTWVLSGNPWLSLSMGGLFPVNPVFAEWLQGYQEIYGGMLTTVSGWTEIGRLWIISAAPALAGCLAGVLCLRKQTGWWIGPIVGGAVGGCWLLSVPYTAGGVFYSMRVLSPLLLLGAAGGGAFLGRYLVGRRSRIVVAGMLGLLTIDASIRALTGGMDPWRMSYRDWPDVGYTWQQEFWTEQEAFFAEVIDEIPGRFVGDASGVQRFFVHQDRDYLPWWSPEVRFLFSADQENDPINELRSLGINHMVFHRVDFSQEFLARTGVLAQLDSRVRAVKANEVFVVFELLPLPQ
ncbi:hypothetical protein N9Z12_02720 [Opitutaceae bacterium]|nr:hypothetical protein [Opitutaceae bacterium]